MTRLQIRRLIVGYIIGGHVLAMMGAYLTARGIKLIPISIAEENKLPKISNTEEALVY